MLKVGEKAPDFTATLEDGSELTLSSFRGQKNVVLYFYLKDFTRGWTVEAREFRENFDEIERLDGVILGVSTDSVESHRRFKDDEDLPYHLVADPDKKVIRLFDVERRIGFRNKRVTYLIDKQGVIRLVDQHEIRMKKHVRSALEGLRELSNDGAG